MLLRSDAHRHEFESLSGLATDTDVPLFSVRYKPIGWIALMRGLAWMRARCREPSRPADFISSRLPSAKLAK
jgi:hypothetical protein